MSDDDRQPPPARRKGRRPIVSSAHLVSESAMEMSEFEFGLIIAYNAFSRWMVQCVEAAGGAELGPLDVLVLHSVNHRNREKRVGDICFVLNIEDTHTVSYSLKKLIAQGLVARTKRGKEALFSTTQAGQDLCASYRDVREDCLIASFKALGLDGESVGRIADRLRALSGLYDQAARAATSL